MIHGCLVAGEVFELTIVVLEAFVDKMSLRKFLKTYLKVVGFPL